MLLKREKTGAYRYIGHVMSSLRHMAAVIATYVPGKAFAPSILKTSCLLGSPRNIALFQLPTELALGREFTTRFRMSNKALQATVLPPLRYGKAASELMR